MPKWEERGKKRFRPGNCFAEKGAKTRHFYAFLGVFSRIVVAVCDQIAGSMHHVPIHEFRKTLLPKVEKWAIVVLIHQRGKKHGPNP